MMKQQLIWNASGGSTAANSSMEVIVVINFARSGGTLLTQVLGSSDDVWILSEINPRAGANPLHQSVNPDLAVLEQAWQWYGVRLKGLGFRSDLKEFRQIAESRGKILVIRDWTFQNFSQKAWFSGSSPSYRFELLEELKDSFPIRPLAFVRDGIDVFLSFGGNLRQFSYDYREFARGLVNHGIPILRYEEFTKHPLQFIQRLSEVTKKELSIDLTTFHTRPATGNLQSGKTSRGIRAKGVVTLPRKRISKKRIFDIEHCGNLMEANRLLGYPEYYYGVDVESTVGMIKRRGLNLVYRFLDHRP